jgi:hypothetical protein
MKKTLFFVSFAVMVILFQFCSSSKKAQRNAPKLSYASSVHTIITGKCAPCHVGANPRQTKLDNYDSAKAHIDTIIRRVHLNPNEKGFMPRMRTKLPDSTIQVFVKWKEGGTKP